VLRIHLLSLAAAALLAGCGTGPAGYPNEALGGSNTHNLIAQASNSFADQRLISTSSRFRSAVPDTVTFDFDSAALDHEARRALDAQASWLKANPTVRMRVTGHTDRVGAESYNSRLGLHRARASVRYLVGKGVARTRLDAVESKGETKPLVVTDERERRNRRAETDVAGFERGFSGPGMDGKRAVLAYRAYTTDKAETAKPTGVAD
jgi:outer membrane protein OmpA-like peptidoglycan-associated protein